MIEHLLKEHLQSQADALRPFLATYNSKLAVFGLEAPREDDTGWDSSSHFGRIVFAVLSERSRERNIRGTLTLTVECKRGEQNPEEIEPIIRPLVDGWFFNSAIGTVSAYWKSSGYSIDVEKDISKVTLTFEIYSYPMQKTDGPDPVERLNQWTKEELPQVLEQDIYVIGYDKNLPEIFKPTKEKPAIYWRLSKTAKCTWIPDTGICSWQTAKIRGHILTSEAEDSAIFIARVIDNTLSQKRQLLFEDKSPLHVDRNIRIERNVRLLRTGQITVDATYGVLNLQPKAEDIEKIYF